MHAQCAYKNISPMEVSICATRDHIRDVKLRGIPHRCVSVKTLTIYIELPLVLHLRAGNIWHAGATVEKLSGIFDTRHECEDAGCCVAIGARLPAQDFHEFKTVYQFNKGKKKIIAICTAASNRRRDKLH